MLLTDLVTNLTVVRSLTFWNFWEVSRFSLYCFYSMKISLTFNQIPFHSSIYKDFYKCSKDLFVSKDF